MFLKERMGKKMTDWVGLANELLRMSALKSYMTLKAVMVLFRKNGKLSLSLNFWFTVPFRFHCEL